MLDPFQILKLSTKSQNTNFLAAFVGVLRNLYQFQFFKDFLDLCTSLCMQNRLEFILAPKEFYTTDEGNCTTIRKPHNKCNYYNITIKKISPEVIMHEISHLVEKEISIDLNNQFKNIIYQDLKYQYSKNISLNSLIQQVMIKELELYQQNQHLSELFARFFQIAAMSKEVVGKRMSTGHKVEDVIRAFPNTCMWLNKDIYKLFCNKIDANIANITKKYVISLEDVKHKWLNETVSSNFIQNQNTQQNSLTTQNKWRKSNHIKPIHGAG